MRRAVVLFIALVVLLGTLLGLRLVRERRAAEGPPGGSGVVEGTTVDLRSRLNARVLALHAAEGSRVEKGAPLVTLDCTEPEVFLAEAEARLAMARAQAQAAEAAAVASLRASEAAAAQAAGSEAQIESLAAQHGLATRNAERMEQMGDAVTVAARDQAQAQAEVLGQQLAASRHTSAASNRQARAATQQERATREQAAAAVQGIQAAEATLRRARLSVAECELRAPLASTVETLVLEPGELAMPGTVLVRLVDTHTPRATFYLPNAELASARPGQPATVRADAFPGRTFSARVITVAHEAEFTPRNVQTRSDRDRLVYPVEVRIEDPERLLLPGMPVEITLAPGVEAVAGRRP
jgi:HlyD family secretion protein